MKKKIDTTSPHKQTNNDLNIQIGIEQIKTLEFVVLEPSEKLINDFNKELLLISFGVNFEYYLEKNILSLILITKYEYNYEKEKIELVKLASKFDFFISQLDKLLKIKNKSVEIQNDIVNTIFSISLSTTRGILAEKTSGNFVGKFYLPILNPVELLKKLNISFLEK